MRNCNDSNCAKWFINAVGKVELTGNVMKVGTTLCPDCVAAMAKEALSVSAVKGKAKSKKD